jgi:hypothetical protein
MAHQATVRFIVVLVVCICLVFVYAVSRTILMGGYLSHEQETVRHSMATAQIALVDAISNLETVALEFAAWEDASSPAGKHLSPRAATILADKLIMLRRLDLLLFFDNTGTLAYGSDRVPNGASPLHRPDELRREFLRDGRIPVLVRQRRVAKGLYLHDGRPMLVVVQPMGTPGESSAARGTMVTAKYLDAEETRRLATLTHLDLQFQPIDSHGLPANLKPLDPFDFRAETFQTHSDGDASIAGIASFRDIFGKPALAMRVSMPREIYRQGQTALRYFMLWVVAITAVAVVVALAYRSRLARQRRARMDSERLFHAFVEQAAEGIVLLDAHDLRIMESNSAFLSISGVPEQKRLPRSFLELPIGTPEALAGLAAFASDGGQAYCGRWSSRDGNGREICLSVNATRIEIDDRQVLCLVLHDVSDTVRAEKELRTSEEMYRQLFNNGSDAIFVHDAVPAGLPGNFTQVNGVACSRLGYTREELLQMTIADIDAPETLRYAPTVTEQLQRDRHAVWDGVHVAKDGRRVQVEISSSLFEIDGREIVISHARDVSVRKQVERALQESEEKYRGLFDRAADAIFLVDVAADGGPGKILDANMQACSRLGYSREELLLMTPFDFDEKEGAESRAAFLRAFYPSGQILFDRTHQAKDGCAIPVEVNAHLVEVLGRKIFMATARDITERRQAAEQIKRLNDRLEMTVEQRTRELIRANRELETFVSSVSHDLRSPLQHIMGFSQLLLESLGEVSREESTGYIQRIHQTSCRMALLIDAMLAMSRVSKAEMRKVKTSLSEKVQLISAELQLAEPDRQVEFIIAEGVTVNGDPRLIHSVMENLLGNAWKYTRCRERAVIEFGVADKDGRRACYVRDNGVGFEMSAATRLFEPFQRLHGAEEYDGVGMGLATVQRIVHRHGGTVWAAAEPGQGASFYFSLDSVRGG